MIEDAPLRLSMLACACQSGLIVRHVTDRPHRYRWLTDMRWRSCFVGCPRAGRMSSARISVGAEPFVFVCRALNLGSVSSGYRPMFRFVNYISTNAHYCQIYIDKYSSLWMRRVYSSCSVSYGGLIAEM